MRIAGSYVSTWPRALLGPAPPLDVTTADLNRVLRGVNSGQSSEAQQPLFHTPGTQSLVVYRQSLTVTTEDPLVCNGSLNATASASCRFATWST